MFVRTMNLMEMNKIHGPKECEHLKILKELQLHLADALDSLAGKDIPSANSHYLSWAATFINKSADGYYWLRSSGRTDASNLLVRPTIEVVFYAVATMRERGFLLRKAYAEVADEKRFFANDANRLAEIDQDIEQFRRGLLAKEPGYPIDQRPLSVFDAARTAGPGFVALYETQYRLFCKFTHGALSAISGYYDAATNAVATKVMMWCTFTLLALLQEHTPSQVPNLKPYQDRLTDICKPQDGPGCG
ncbi:MAG: DUF5677 domain-containing protein [Verrucomicrobiota bacterium]